jgi:Nucleoside-diphosphate-sugar epimerases
MERIIVTGATGFIGSNFVKAAKNNYEVHVIVRPGSDISCIDNNEHQIQFHSINGDIVEIIDLFRKVRPDIVVHIASKFCSQHSSGDIEGLVNSNILLGTQVLEAMSKSACHKIINIGTSWQHYDNADYNPVNLYAATKEAFKDIIRYYEETHKIIALNLELFDTYGPNDNRKKLLSLLKGLINGGDSLEMSPGEQKINLLFITDVVDGILVALNNIKTMQFSGTYVLRAREQVTLKDLVALSEQITGHKLTVKWGMKEYRNREVMDPYCKGIDLPNWMPQMSLLKGLKLFYES